MLSVQSARPIAAKKGNSPRRGEKNPWWVWLLPLPVVWLAALAVACRWKPGMKITALLDALNSALAEPFALAWVSNSPRFLLVFTVIYAVAVIVAVTDQKNTRPGAEHGSAAWGDVFRLNKFYMDRHGSNLLLTQHFHIGIDGYKHKHNTNILIVGGSGAGKTRTYVAECTGMCLLYGNYRPESRDFA